MNNAKSETASYVLLMSLVRTLVPVLVGGVLAWFAARGIAVDPSLETTMTVALTGAATFVYYAVVRFMEMKVSPKFGWLLGNNSSPDSYSPGRPPFDAAPDESEDAGLADGAPVQDDVVRVDRTTIVG